MEGNSNIQKAQCSLGSLIEYVFHLPEGARLTATINQAGL